jgi:hypothetical protein
MIHDRQPGINLIGPESPCFGFSPTAMCLLINNIGLFNASAIGLCSRRLGFPFPARYALRDDGYANMELAPGLQRIIRPIERASNAPEMPFLYQSILGRGISTSDDLNSLFDTEYVRENSLDFGRGRGSIFLQKRGSALKYSDEPSREWIPENSLSLRRTYHVGRRWAYRQLELHYDSLARERPELRLSFRGLHGRLLSFYEAELGL